MMMMIMINMAMIAAKEIGTAIAIITIVLSSGVVVVVPPDKTEEPITI